MNLDAWVFNSRDEKLLRQCCYFYNICFTEGSETTSKHKEVLQSTTVLSFLGEKNPVFITQTINSCRDACQKLS